MRTHRALIWARYRLIICLTLPMATTALIRGMNHKQYKLIESYMDASANPCMDFYQYACGNWRTVHANESYDNTFEMVDYQLDKEYESVLLARKQELDKQHRFVRQLLAYYKSCTSVTEYLLMKYLRKLESYETELVWPQFEQRRRHRSPAATFWTNLKRRQQADLTENLPYWFKMLATLRKYGLNGIFLAEELLQANNDSRQYLIDFDRPVLEEEFEILTRVRFDVLMEEVGVTHTNTRNSLWQAINEFELKLLALYDIEDTIGYEVMQLSALTIPQLKNYLEILLNGTNVRIDMVKVVGITNRAYMHALFNFLGKYDEEFICRYLMVRFLWHLHYDGPTDFTEIACIQNLREELPLAMAWLHEEQHPELMSETANIQSIFESLRAHFAATLDTNPNRFDGDVLQFLRTKLKHMQLKVGNLPRNATVATMEAFHRELTLHENDFYGNHLKVLRFLARKQLQHLGQRQDSQNFYYVLKNDFGSSSTPYYLPRHNMVMVPMTLLHLPLYHPQLHEIFKYSLMGFLLAHEITHGFDESGLDYDEHGNLRDGIGDQIKANEIFDGHLDCLLAKNPRVIDEKIADVSGLRWAYETYSGAHNVTQHLPWSQMSQQQLFFRNFAVFFCGDDANDALLVNSTHGTYRSRLHDTISQFEEFGHAFNCPTGATMNPQRKCQLWR